MHLKDKNLKYYNYGLGFKKILPKYWLWFAKPFDVKGAAMVNFFSYEKYDVEGFKRSDGLTTVIDLRQDLDNIWSQMRKKYTRKLIIEGEKKGIEIKQDKNFSEFKKIYKHFRKVKKLSSDPFALLQQGTFFSAYYKGEMIAGHIFVVGQKEMRSWVTASSHLAHKKWKDKRLVGCANRMLIWQAIKWGKNQGIELFDLGGISPDSKNSGLRTLAEFKESFGGQRKECYYYFKVYSPIIKWWMRFRGFTNV